MNKQEFDNLQVGDEIYCEITDTTQVRTVVSQIFQKEGIILNKHRVPYRFENCEIVVEDKLVEYLKTNQGALNVANIRKICREEFLRDMKIPSYDEFLDGYDTKTLQKLYNWFITETKRLNGG